MTLPSLSLAAVVVTYNRLEKLKVTLATLLAHEAALLAHVVVVDNASEDGTADWLATQEDPRLVVLRSADNLGGAGGFEWGMRHATEQFDPDWLVVMDDDARPLPGSLARFHAFAPEAGEAIAAGVFFPEGDICEMNRPSRNPFWSLQGFLRTALKGRSGFHIPDAFYQTPTSEQVDVTSFVGFFISRQGIALAGLPDPALFIYGDDALYTLELSRRGGRIDFVPTIGFEHDFTTFARAAKGQRFLPLWKAYYHSRNLLLLYRKAAGVFFVPILFVILPKWLMKLRHHKGERRAFLRLMVCAVWDGLRRNLTRSHAEVRRLSER